jgi:hypothetical protein
MNSAKLGLVIVSTFAAILVFGSFIILANNNTQFKSANGITGNAVASGFGGRGHAINLEGKEIAADVTESNLNCSWTSWKNRDIPSGTGDWETLKDFANICKDPVAIECQTTKGVDASETGQIVTCSAAEGLTCKTADNSKGCKDYKVRFCCPNTIKTPQVVSKQSSSDNKPSTVNPVTQIATKTPEATCTDSDGGLNYFEKGTTTKDKGTIYYSKHSRQSLKPKTDFCIGHSKFLVEYTCSTSHNTNIKTKYYRCPNGCKDGACIGGNTTPCPEYAQPLCENGTITSGTIGKDGCRGPPKCTIIDKCLAIPCPAPPQGEGCVYQNITYDDNQCKTSCGTLVCTTNLCTDTNPNNDGYSKGLIHNTDNSPLESDTIREYNPSYTEDTYVQVSSSTSALMNVFGEEKTVQVGQTVQFIVAKLHITNISFFGVGNSNNEVQAEILSINDFCKSTSAVSDYYCNADISVGSKEIQCLNGCSNGNCIPSTPVEAYYFNDTCNNGIVGVDEECDGSKISRGGVYVHLYKNGSAPGHIETITVEGYMYNLQLLGLNADLTSVSLNVSGKLFTLNREITKSDGSILFYIKDISKSDANLMEATIGIKSALIENCADLTIYPYNFTDGTLSCTSDCKYDTSACTIYVPNVTIQCSSNDDCSQGGPDQNLSLCLNNNTSCLSTTTYSCANPGTANAACVYNYDYSNCTPCSNGCDATTGACSLLPPPPPPPPAV